ncbi:oxidoreductase [Fusarium avenaceum]|nr:oxidoreductase [Fusarium avenaceum]
MASSFESNVAAILPQKQGLLTTGQRPVTSPGPLELLVRNKVVAANPSDWKVQTYGVLINDFPAVLGSELTGVVAAVGSNVTRFKAGDRVMCFALGVLQSNSNKAAFQTYTLMDEAATAHLPDNLTFEEGAVLPVGMITASIALFKSLGLPMGEKPEHEKGAIVVWSGASAVGVAALQIAHALGWSVFVTASPKHHEWLKELGATDAWDYRDPDVAQKIAQAIKSEGLTIPGVVDARSEGSSFASVAAITSAADSADEIKVSTLAPWPADVSIPEMVQVHHTDCSRFTQEYPEIGRWVFGSWLQKALEEEEVKPAPRPHLIDGGLGSVQRMLDSLKAGASGEKFIVKV